MQYAYHIFELVTRTIFPNTEIEDYNDKEIFIFYHKPLMSLI